MLSSLLVQTGIILTSSPYASKQFLSNIPIIILWYYYFIPCHIYPQRYACQRQTKIFS